MKTLALLSLFCSALVAHSEVIVYSQAFNLKVSGHFAVRSTLYSGYVVLDTDGRMIQLETRTVNTPLGKSKQYKVIEFHDPRVRYLNTGILKSTYAMTFLYEDGGALLKGSASSVNTGTQNTLIGKTLTLSGYILEDDESDAVVKEFKGIMLYSSVKTKAANLAGHDIHDTVAALRAGLEARGYVLTNELEDIAQ